MHNIAKKAVNKLRLAYSALNSAIKSAKSPHLSGPAKSLQWIRRHELLTGGIRVHSLHSDAYPEVTGYLVPTLLQYGERDLAVRLIRWLICIQRADGSYTGSDGIPFVFDTGQVLRGLLAGTKLVPRALDSAVRAANYLYEKIMEGADHGFEACYSGTIPESIHLYTLPPLFESAVFFNKPEYAAAAEHCLEHYCSHRDALQVSGLTHFLAYELDALIDLGRTDMAIPLLNKLQELQTDDGALRGKSGSSWVCTPGLAQIAICWYKTGNYHPADKALNWLENHQGASGGFLGSYGRKASYIPHAELPWTAKFYLDAHLLRLAAYFERDSHGFPIQVSKNDGRVQAILSVVRPRDRVLEVGRGNGRYLKVICDNYTETKCSVVVFSPSMFENIPPGIETRCGSMEAIPFSDNSFDVVFSVEAIESSVNAEAAVAEMIRVAKRGGWIVVIDKQQPHWRRLTYPPWERWPEIQEINRLLRKACDRVTAEQVGYDSKPVSDGLMIAWIGQKRSDLSGSEWRDISISPSAQETLVRRVQHNHIAKWVEFVFFATFPGEKVLEVGCRTGEASLHLAQSGRKVTILAFNLDALKFIRRCAGELSQSLDIVLTDVTRPLPFGEHVYDCVWSSGLLEHFTTEERRNILREQARVTRKTVIALVPNAACVAYRAGKKYQEEEGSWLYGLETPIISLRDDFEAVGLHVESETTVGAQHALSSLPPNHPLRKALSSWVEGLSSKELQDCSQGYLLVTVGSRATGGNEC